MIRAVFVRLKGGNVTLKKEDGKVISVPVSNLSDADQRFLDTVPPDEPKEPGGLLTGTWEASGEHFDVQDDGKEVTIDLSSGNFLKHLRESLPAAPMTHNLLLAM